MIKEVALQTLYPKKNKSLNPANFEDETFALYSIGAYDKGKPDIIKGKEIGSSKKMLEPNDVILSRIVPHIQRCWVVPQKNDYIQIGSGEWIVFRNEKIHPNYLRYYLISKPFHSMFMGTVKGVGGSLLRADPKQVGRFKILLPTMETQKRIAKILDDAVALRDKSKKLLAEYDLLAQSIFLEMFGGPVDNPKKWKISKLMDVCNKITDGTHQGPKFKSTGIPFLLVSNIVDNEINYETKKFIDEDEYYRLTKSTKIDVGDLLYTSVGSYGNPAIVKDKRKFCFQRHIAHLKIKSEMVNAVFLHAMMKSPLVKRQADKFAIGVAQKTLNLKTIRNFDIYHPPYPLQNQFAEKIDLIEKQKKLAKQGLKESEDLFNCLLQKAFKGELA